MEFGKPEKGQDLVGFVLSHIKDRKQIDSGIDNAVKAVKEVILHGIDAAMNKYN